MIMFTASEGLPKTNNRHQRSINGLYKSFHCYGAHPRQTVFSNVCLGKVAVSFSHIIIAMEPYLSVILSAMFRA
ncbi:hypothetical protein M8C21_009584, partial [Ambrosia artemisiifolia]